MPERRSLREAIERTINLSFMSATRPVATPVQDNSWDSHIRFSVGNAVGAVMALPEIEALIELADSCAWLCEVELVKRLPKEVVPIRGIEGRLEL